MVTDVKVRAERRYKELLEKGEKVTLEEVLNNLVERDRLDSSRANAPLKKADDAIEIDTTHISIQQQVQKILDCVGVVA
jgi:cytidylate kinase